MNLSLVRRRWLAALLLAAAAPFAPAQDFYENGPLELQLYRGEGDRAYATIIRREGVQPAERLGSALPLRLEGAKASSEPKAAAQITLQFSDRAVRVEATGKLPHDVPAETIRGDYHASSPEARIAVAKERAGKLDAELNRVYGELKTKLPADRFNELRELQREWLRSAYEEVEAGNVAAGAPEFWLARGDRAADRIKFLEAYPDSPSAADQELHAQLQAAEAASAWPAVAEIARRILAGAPKDSAIWEARTHAFARAEDWTHCTTALDAWEKAVSPRPAAIDAYRGDVAWADDKTEEAIQRWTAYLKSAAKDTEHRDKLAAALETRGDYPGAATVLEERLKIAPEAEAGANLAREYALGRNWKKMSAAIRRAGQLDATSPLVKSILPRIERLEKALPDIKSLDRAGAASPSDPNPGLERGLLFQQLGWPELSLQEAEAAGKTFPGARRPILQQASALMALHRKDEAEALENVSLAVDPATRATFLRSLGDADVAAAKDPRSAAALTARAESLNEMEQYHLAEIDAAAALKLAPGSEPALAAHGEALSQIGEHWKALPELARATELNPRDVRAWLVRGRIECWHKNYPAAIEALTHALDLQPRLKEALELRERAARVLGKIAEADVDAARLKTFQ